MRLWLRVLFVAEDSTEGSWVAQNVVSSMGCGILVGKLMERHVQGEMTEEL